MPPKRKAPPKKVSTSPASSRSPSPSSKRTRKLPATSQKGVGNPNYAQAGLVTSYIAKAATPGYTSVQVKVCQSIKDPNFEKCVSCIEKQAICGGCRFQNLRVFAKLGNGEADMTDYVFVGNQDEDSITSVKSLAPPPRAVPEKPAKKSHKKKPEPKPKPVVGKRRSARSRPAEKEEQPEKKKPETDVPIKAEAPPDNVKADSDPELLNHAKYVLPIIAPTFAEMLRRELRHEFTHTANGSKDENQIPGGARPVVRLLPTPLTRSLCDTCATSIFMGSYLCGCCGRECCLGCWESWQPPSRDTKFEKVALIRMADLCSRKRLHCRDSYVFTTRAHPGELEEILKQTEARIPQQTPAMQGSKDLNIPTITNTWPVAGEGPAYLPVPTVPISDISLQKFQAHWAKMGIPLVVTGLSNRFKLKWDDKYFQRRYGDQQCTVHDCRDGSRFEMSVRGFFEGFSGEYGQSWKLKDWPPQADFAKTFPVLFQDFENALPFPSYTTRKGVLNLASRFPADWNQPDLGPKMYNAYPSPDFLPEDAKPPRKGDEEILGTTNLHLDITDAVNIMVFAAGGENAMEESTTDKGIPLCGAIWDIFPPSSAADIRRYLNSVSADPVDDPIHRQLFYLSEEDLFAIGKPENGSVKSYRIFQNPGEAVFIPAGCPHQVRNRRSCVKVAVDFLTAENVNVCRGLLEEARAMASELGRDRQSKKEDVLQMWNCLYFAWKFMLDIVERNEKKDEAAGGASGDGSGSSSSEGPKNEQQDLRTPNPKHESPPPSDPKSDTAVSSVASGSVDDADNAAKQAWVAASTWYPLTESEIRDERMAYEAGMNPES